jgi:hypothetical protein
MGELECILPDELKNAAVESGKELLLPYVAALAAITVASNHQIAILGIEAFEIRNDGLRTVNYSDPSASIPFTGDWKAYVENMNAESERWLAEHPFGENHGYILTSASERELADAKERIR